MTFLIITPDGIAHAAEWVCETDTHIEVFFTHNGKAARGRALRSALVVYGPRHDPWYDLDVADITWYSVYEAT